MVVRPMRAIRRPAPFPVLLVPDGTGGSGMRTDRASEHLRLEVAAAFVRGEPLAAGASVPGCCCETCTGIPDDHPAAVPAWRRRNPDRAALTDPGRGRARALKIKSARAVPILEVARRLGCNDPVKRGREVRVRCPIHNDHDPSLRIDPDRGLWFCDPCGEGGDGIRLWMRARRLGFAEAVRELAA